MFLDADNHSKENIRCSRGLWDTSVPGIKFDDHGVSNYAVMFDALCNLYPRGVEGEEKWERNLTIIRKNGNGRKYDCVIGVSGGTDSCYLLYLAKKIYGLRPLAVTLDNGWSSDIALKNIEKLTNALEIDLETVVIDYEAVKTVLKAYMAASLPWIDSPTDRAINAALYRTAEREGIHYIIVGNDFRSEGKQPIEWTYNDSKMFNHIMKKYTVNKNYKYFPQLTDIEFLYLSAIKRIKTLRPFYHVEYSKQEAQLMLKSQFGWEDYGGHHHENLFTKFVINCWLPQKFNIDKKIITYSAQILSGKLTREEALQRLVDERLSNKQAEELTKYVLKKLDLKQDEYQKMLASPNKYYFDYPSHYQFIIKNQKKLKWLFSKINSYKPTFFVEQEMRNQ